MANSQLDIVLIDSTESSPVPRPSVSAPEAPRAQAPRPVEPPQSPKPEIAKESPHHVSPQAIPVAEFAPGQENDKLEKPKREGDEKGDKKTSFDPRNFVPGPAKKALDMGVKAGKAVEGVVDLASKAAKGAESLGSLAVNALSAATGLGPVGLAAGAAAAALGSVVVSAIAVKMAFDSQVEKLKDISGPVANAEAMSEIRQEMAMMRRANDIGPQLARYETMRGKVDEQLAHLQTEILKALLELYTSLEPILQHLPLAVGVITAHVPVISDAVVVAADMARGNLIKAGQDFAQLLATLGKVPERIAKAIKETEAEDFEYNDQFFDGFLDGVTNLKEIRAGGNI